MKKEKFPKQLKVFELLKESEQKRWYDDKQIVTAYPAYFLRSHDIDYLDNDPKCEKRFFLKYTEDFLIYLKHDVKNGFHGDRYRVVKLYDFDYIRENIDKEYFERQYSLTDEVFSTKYKNNESFRDIFADRRNRKYMGTEVPVVEFSGEKRTGLHMYMKDDAYRSYYGMFMMGPYVRHLFKKVFATTDRELDVIMYLYPFQFFVKTDLGGYYRVKLNSGHTMNQSIKELLDLGLIREVEYGKTSMYRRRRSNSTHFGKTKRTTKMYQVTEKLNYIAKYYMDCIMLKRKLPRDGGTFSDIVDTHFDFHLREWMADRLEADRKKNPKKNANSRYWDTTRMKMTHSIYEEVYEYVNFRHVAEFMDDEVFDECKRAGNIFKFNPFLWQITKTNYLKSQGKNNNARYNNAFLKRQSFGLDLE